MRSSDVDALTLVMLQTGCLPDPERPQRWWTSDRGYTVLRQDRDAGARAPQDQDAPWSEPEKRTVKLTI